jgi:hypothetical protein
MKRNAKLASLVAIGAALAPRDASLVSKVTLAVEDASRYVKRHAKEMRLRGIKAPTADLPWIALIDALCDAGACAEVDWKEGRPEVFGAIRGLPKHPKGALATAAKKIGDDDRSTWELLEIVGEEIATTTSVRLGSLDMHSDNYCLVVVAADDARAIAKHAKTAGYGALVVFTGKHLAEATKERLASAKKKLTAGRGKNLPYASLPAPGAVYLVPLEGGMFGACRVLRRSTDDETQKWGRCIVVATTRWIGARPPSLDEPELRDVLVLTHHSWKNEPHRMWIDDVPPAEYECIGSIPPSAEDERVEVKRFAGQRAVRWTHAAIQRALQRDWDAKAKRARR